MKRHQRIWSRKILKVIEAYNNNPDLLLFGVTGDLDNLGIFVSRYGRPLAENLVDVYNRLIGAFMYDFIRRHSETIPTFCMIPSGEEVFATGVATDKSVVDELFFSLGDGVNNFIRENACLADDDVTISFGCKVFTDDVINTTTATFVDLVKKGQVKEASSAYLELMLVMRQELAYELDRAKFASLNASGLDLVVLFRNIVYVKLQEYKTGTRQALVALAERLCNDPVHRARLQAMTLNSEYGITEEDARFVSELLSEK